MRFFGILLAAITLIRTSGAAEPEVQPKGDPEAARLREAIELLSQRIKQDPEDAGAG